MQSSSSRFAPLLRALDVTVLALATAATVYLVVRTPPPEFHELFEPPVDRWTGYGSIYLVTVALVTWGWRAKRTISARRLLGYATACLSMVFALSRLLTPEQVIRFPPVLSQSFANRLSELSPKDQVTWAARVASHRVATMPPAGDSAADRVLSPLSIPASWAFPENVQIAVDRSSEDTLWIWAQTPKGERACFSIPARRGAPLCDMAKGADPSLHFAAPVRVAAAPPSEVPDSIGVPWVQYRGDSEKTGTAGGASAAIAGTSWQWQSDGEFRSTASVVGPLAIIGTHGTGSLIALDVLSGATRWTTRLPNWVHQDVVSDGRAAFVGFGDNGRSFQGRTPSGVAAFDVGSGRHRWTVFDESSVMTSPIVAPGAIVYGTAAGIIRRRDMRDGHLLHERKLDGGVIMAPPSSVGDTIVFSLDDARVCALTLSQLDQLWCSTFYGEQVGHSGTTISRGVVIGTAVLALRHLRLTDLTRQTFVNAVREIWSNIVMPTRTAGQVMFALDLHTGKLLWKTRVFGQTRAVDGHSSGTAVVTGSTGIVVLPMTDSIIAFNVADGAIRWTAGAHQARGPSLVVDDKVIVAGRDGITEVRRVADGALTCTMTRRVGYDRAGPARAGGTLLFADLNGGLEAVPANALLSCDPAQLAKKPAIGASTTPAHGEH